MAKQDTSSIYTQPSGTVALSGIDAPVRLYASSQTLPITKRETPCQ